jgi:hypothetical protein
MIAIIVVPEMKLRRMLRNEQPGFMTATETSAKSQ